MLGFLCARRKTWILSSLSTFSHCPAVVNHQSRRIVQTQQLLPHQSFFSGDTRGRHYHNTACQLGSACGGGAAATIWHAILPSKGLWRRRDLRRPAIHYELKGEGSWNAAVDARPARWLHRPDSAWLLFGVCNCLAPIDWSSITNSTAKDEQSSNKNKSEAGDSKSAVTSDENVEKSADYRVTGVPTDGRCLFRAIAHGACLRNGEEPPDEDRQRELADELRAQVVDELLKRREESEWYIEGDFDTYVERIQQTHVWGGEPELLMASHVKKMPISVYMVDRSSGGLVNIAKYGEEYGKEKEKPINVLFYGYGHYDILESFSEQSMQKASM